MGSYKYCLFFKRTFGWSEAQPPEDVKQLFKEYGEGGSHMSMEQFKRFLASSEVDDDPNKADKIFEWILEQKNRIKKRISRTLIHLDDLQTYLFSNELNPVMKPQV
ncbi:Phosphoinositide phospholipase C [Rhynchospora pubera]|uniref:Phosphoinositide phospholipase C n=1 Tax=Rhynchospora pubera TaxID=906938 RepID=A0AAV8HJS1_9POAL|nr:Phosphoinositide phospholipase C [Rhynchospora pubera]KAJ4816894.1 Phosphoinositide phospholipase C [Rhynchospora pubera]